MDFINRFFNRREAATPAACTTEQTQRTAQSASFGAQAVQVNSPTAALQVSAWYRASEVLANTMSMLVMEYQKKNDRAHGGNYSIDNDARGGGQGHYLNYLLQVRPNPTMDATQFWKQMTLRRFYDGNAVAYIERDAMDNIAALWVCTSASLIRDTEGMKYNITYNTPGGQRNLITDATEVIHWRNTFSNDCGLTGIGTLKYAAQTLSLAATNDKQARENAAKGGKQKLLLREDTSSVTAGLKKLNKEQKTKQRDDLQEAINNNQDVLLMSGLMDVNVISQDAAQMQLLEARKFDVPQVARFTGVPPSMLMDNTNNTYKASFIQMDTFFVGADGNSASSYLCAGKSFNYSDLNEIVKAGMAERGYHGWTAEGNQRQGVAKAIAGAPEPSESETETESEPGSEPGSSSESEPVTPPTPPEEPSSSAPAPEEPSPLPE